MLKAIIIDDEQHCVDRISKLLSKYNNDLDIVKICTNLEDAKYLQRSMIVMRLMLLNSQH